MYVCMHRWFKWMDGWMNKRTYVRSFVRTYNGRDWGLLVRVWLVAVCLSLLTSLLCFAWWMDESECGCFVIRFEPFLLNCRSSVANLNQADMLLASIMY